MKYSIITINLNNRDGLRKTIESVINQTCKDFEYIVIDGGSTDGSVEVIKEYADKINYWVSEPDKGIYNAMNKGILQAHGEYLNFMNSGDCFYDENVLCNCSSFLQYDIVSGNIIIEESHSPWNWEGEEVTMMLFYNGSLAHPASFIRATLFKNSLYDETLKIVSDWKFFIEKLILENCSFRKISLNIARFDKSGISSTNVSLNDSERKQVLSQIFPKRVLMDYERYKDKESPVLDLIPEFNKTYRLQRIIVTVIKWILFIYKMGKKK